MLNLDSLQDIFRHTFAKVRCFDCLTSGWLTLINYSHIREWTTCLRIVGFFETLPMYRGPSIYTPRGSTKSGFGIVWINASVPNSDIVHLSHSTNACLRPGISLHHSGLHLAIVFKILWKEKKNGPKNKRKIETTYWLTSRISNTLYLILDDLIFGRPSRQ